MKRRVAKPKRLSRAKRALFERGHEEGCQEARLAYQVALLRQDKIHKTERAHREDFFRRQLAEVFVRVLGLVSHHGMHRVAIREEMPGSGCSYSASNPTGPSDYGHMVKVDAEGVLAVWQMVCQELGAPVPVHVSMPEHAGRMDSRFYTVRL